MDSENNLTNSPLSSSFPLIQDDDGVVKYQWHFTFRLTLVNMKRNTTKEDYPFMTLTFPNGIKKSLLAVANNYLSRNERKSIRHQQRTGGVAWPGVNWNSSPEDETFVGQVLYRVSVQVWPSAKMIDYFVFWLCRFECRGDQDHDGVKSVWTYAILVTEFHSQ